MSAATTFIDLRNVTVPVTAPESVVGRERMNRGTTDEEVETEMVEAGEMTPATAIGGAETILLTRDDTLDGMIAGIERQID